MKSTSKKQELEEELDPSHNKGLMIELFDNKKQGMSAEPSLADMFRAKKKEAQKRQKDKTPLDQDGQGQEEPISQQVKAPKKERTKEEILELRKQMMKSKVTKKEEKK